MINQSHIDMLTLISTPLKKVASGHGGEYHGPCPVCGGKDRFVLWSGDNRCFCRQCHPEPMDPIAFIQFRDNVDFPTACNILNIHLDQQPRQQKPRRQQPTAPPPPISTGLDPDKSIWAHDYQQNARDFVEGFATFNLWSDIGQPALSYLMKRGITPTVAKRFNLGFNSETHYENWSTQLEKSVWLPRGIVIPWVVDGQIHRVNIRRSPVPAGEAKYISAAGYANSLFNANAISPDKNLIVVEGEFDALLLESDFVAAKIFNYVAVATGSASGSRKVRWATRMSIARHVYLAFDNDPAGYQAFLWWQHALGKKNVTRLQPGTSANEKDPTETYERFGYNGLRDWLAQTIPTDLAHKSPKGAIS